MKAKPVIKSLAQATCENCVYSNPQESFSICCLKAPSDSLEDAIRMMHDEFCGQGLWMANDGDVETPFPQTLRDLHYLFLREGDCGHCFTGEGCGQ